MGRVLSNNLFQLKSKWIAAHDVRIDSRRTL